MNKKIFRIICTLGLCLVIIFSAFLAFKDAAFFGFWQTSHSNAPGLDPDIIAREEPAKAQKETGDSPPVILERFADLYQENPDLVGWIRVPGTNIDYPVTQSTDNEFYLNHDFQKEPSKNGVPFLDKDADILTGNQSLSIYGHYIKGIMFTELHKYKKLEFYQENPIFHFDSLYDVGTFKIFSVFYMAGNRSDELFYYYPISRFQDEDAFMEHVRQLQIRSIFTIPIDIVPEDQLVLLTCCSYETDNLRLVIAGRKIRSGEDPAVDAFSATVNPAPLYPQKWYDLKGGHPVAAN